MITEVLASAPGSYALAAIAGVGVGLSLSARSTAARVGAMLNIVAFTAIAATHLTHALWAGPIFALASAFTLLTRDVHQYANSPMLAGTPYAQRLLLMLVHGKKIKASSALALSDGATAQQS